MNISAIISFTKYTIKLLTVTLYRCDCFSKRFAVRVSAAIFVKKVKQLPPSFFDKKSEIFSVLIELFIISKKLDTFLSLINIINVGNYGIIILIVKDERQKVLICPTIMSCPVKPLTYIHSLVRSVCTRSEYKVTDKVFKNIRWSAAARSSFL